MKKNLVYILSSLLLIISLLALNSKSDFVFKDYNINELLISQKYYISNNHDNYLFYYSTHPETSLEDVIAIVNTTSQIQSTDISKNNEILINKYNYLENDYIPANLVDIDIKYAYEGKKIKQEVYDNFINMYNDALKNNINLLIISAYRDYNYQEYLYNNNVSMYGVDYANQVSAQAGYSEHQSGLALDIISKDTTMENFYNSDDFQWLFNNCYKYGFILRYPEEKTYLTGYTFEPWHYRYVGKDIALRIKKENITFDEYYAFYLNNFSI